MTQDNFKEIFPIVDEMGNVIGAASRAECHGGSKLLHPVVHLHLFDKNGNIYLQKRPEWKDIQPGKWDTAVGGHVDLGENILQAIAREVREEIGLDIKMPQLIARYIFESDIEREMVNVFRTVTDEIPKPSDELDGGRFWTPEEIRSSIGKGVFTPNFESEYQKFFLPVSSQV